MTTRQLRVYQTLWDTVWAEYVYPDFNGYDWKAIGAKYKALVEAGLTDEDFYQAMDLMLAELGDEHSRFDSPEAVAMAEAEFEGRIDYVGVGILVSAVPEAARGVIILTFPDSPAAEAGLGPHDSILAVNGEMLLDAAGDRLDQIRGPEGTTVMLTVQRPGESPFDLTLTRQRITGPLPIDYCLIPGTRLAYIFLPGLNDSTIPDQMREALEALTAAGPLDGLILDNRQNGGGESTVLEAVLGFFMHGTVGHFVSPINSRPLTIRAEDVGGSQAAPLVVLVDEETASFGEVLSGVLQAMDQAQIVGQTTPGNVEILWGYGFEDGSRAWIAHETFQPLRQPNGIWEETGIVPDVHTPTRWDLFTEATD
ncbi:MAG: S41 family peptidase, partial [Anaerolineales bacterium]